LIVYAPKEPPVKPNIAIGSGLLPAGCHRGGESGEFGRKKALPQAVRPMSFSASVRRWWGKAWDYTMFGESRQLPEPDEAIPMVFGKINGGTGGFNRWTIRARAIGRLAVVPFPRLPPGPLCALGETAGAADSDTRREEIPAPSTAKRGQRPIPVPWWLAPKLALYRAMRDHGIDNSELVRRLRVNQSGEDPGGSGGMRQTARHASGGRGLEMRTRTTLGEITMPAAEGL
jgi:hypothetical protein